MSHALTLQRGSLRATPSLTLGARCRAFTVIELLVVISLIVILVLIAAPSFQTMIYTSEEGMAETHVRGAIRAARDIAIRSNGAADGAAVFFFEPGGRLTIFPCIKVGELTDWAGPTGTDTTRREVFAPAPGFNAATLPGTWMVRGYVTAHAFTDAWYGSSYANLTTNTDQQTRGQRNWVFPETGFYDEDQTSQGFKRSTFMVRFRAGTGALVGASTEPALVFAPRNSAQNRTASPFNSEPRADREGRNDPVKFVRTWLNSGVANNGVANRRDIIGRRSSDMVLARPVAQLAVYNERKLAAALRVPIDRTTGCIYHDPATTAPPFVPMYTDVLYLSDIDSWIEGDTTGPGGVRDGVVKPITAISGGEPVDTPEAKLFAIDRLTGVLRAMEVQP